MLPADTKVVSVDDHIIEHPNVWQDRLPAKWRERGPKVRHEDGIPIWHYDGKRYPPLGLDAVAGDDPTEFKLDSKKFEAMRPGCYDPKHRLEDMDTDGIWASLAFPQFPRFAGQTFLEGADHELGLACVQAWNDFVLDEWCATDPRGSSRCRSCRCGTPQLCAAEIERTAARGAARHHVLGEPRRARAAVVLVGRVGPDALGAGGDGHRAVPAHRLVVAPDHSPRRRAHTLDHLADEPAHDGGARPTS